MILAMKTKRINYRNSSFKVVGLVIRLPFRQLRARCQKYCTLDLVDDGVCNSLIVLLVKVRTASCFGSGFQPEPPSL